MTIEDGLLDQSSYREAVLKVAFVVNHSNPENCADLRSAIAAGECGHPYTAIAQFAEAVRLWPNCAKTFESSGSPSIDPAMAFQSVALINFNKAAGFTTMAIPREALLEHPFSKMLVEQIKLYEPKLIICFGVEPFQVLIDGLGPCEWRDPIDREGMSPYLCWMTQRLQAIANFGYFKDNDARLGEMYAGFIELLEWAAL